MNAPNQERKRDVKAYNKEWHVDDLKTASYILSKYESLPLHQVKQHTPEELDLL